MISGSYKETTGIMTIPSAVGLAPGSNSSNPGIITLANGYFCVERINTIHNPGYIASIMIKSTYSNNDIANSLTFPVNSLECDGLKNENGKPLVIFAPKDQLQIIAYNSEGSSLSISLELEGYYINENGKRFIDNQQIENITSLMGE